MAGDGIEAIEGAIGRLFRMMRSPHFLHGFGAGRAIMTDEGRRRAEQGLHMGGIILSFASGGDEKRN